jgi:hypothetical protein
VPPTGHDRSAFFPDLTAILDKRGELLASQGIDVPVEQAPLMKRITIRLFTIDVSAMVLSACATGLPRVLARYDESAYADSIWL